MKTESQAAADRHWAKVHIDGDRRPALQLPFRRQPQILDLPTWRERSPA